eukprot:gene13057-13184_t
MARALAESLMPGEPQGVMFFSCGELSERHSISRLVGAPPGYVGYGKGGLLTEAIRRRPHSLVVFDDIERAHPDVVGLLAQAVEEGRLMDSLGHMINLRSTVILFTANTAMPAVTSLLTEGHEKASREQLTATGTAASTAAPGSAPSGRPGIKGLRQVKNAVMAKVEACMEADQAKLKTKLAFGFAFNMTWLTSTQASNFATTFIYENYSNL